MRANFDDTLSYVGFGRYQRGRIAVLCFIVAFSTPVWLVATVFALFTPQFACTSWEDGDQLGEYGGECERTAIDNTTISCLSFNYTTGSDTNLVTQHDLVCDSAWSKDLIACLLFLSFAAGCLSGISADVFGRKKPLFISLLVGSVSGIVSVCSTTPWMFMCFQVLTCFCSAPLWVSCYLIALEVVGQEYRPMATGLLAICTSLGAAFACLYVFLSEYWVHTNLCAFIPSINFLVFCMFLDESPRWYHSRTKPVDLRSLVRRMLITNKTYSNEADLIKSLQPQSFFFFELRARIASVFTTTALLRSMAIAATCLSATTYLAVTLIITIIRLPGINFSSLGLIFLLEILCGYFIIVLADRLGRIWPMTISGALAAHILLIMSGIQPQSTTVWLLMGCLSWFFLRTSQHLMTLSLAELSPTALRGTCIGVPWAIASLGSLIAFLAYSRWSMIGAEITAVFASCLPLLLPETVGLPLLDTYTDLTSRKLRPSRPALIANLKCMGRQRPDDVTQEEETEDFDSDDQVDQDDDVFDER